MTLDSTAIARRRSVATRTDAKNNWFMFLHDEPGRRRKAWITTQSACAGGSAASSSITYQYSPDGKPSVVTVKDGAKRGHY